MFPSYTGGGGRSHGPWRQVEAPGSCFGVRAETGACRHEHRDDTEQVAHVDELVQSVTDNCPQPWRGCGAGSGIYGAANLAIRLRISSRTQSIHELRNRVRYTNHSLAEPVHTPAI